MALPDLIELVPLERPPLAAVTVPGSKSITNRALILAALGNGRTVLRGALWSEDTQIMVTALKKLGFEVEVREDSEEFCNRTIVVDGREGKVPNAGSKQQPLEVFVGNAGTAARFLSALVCLGQGTYRLHGTNRMHERPQGALFKALGQLGYDIEAENDRLPAIIHGTGPKEGQCSVSISESSQFASALLLGAERGKWTVKVEGENSEESPYVTMTSELIAAFKPNPGEFQIEPDVSSASYFWAIGWLFSVASESNDTQVFKRRFESDLVRTGDVFARETIPSVVVRHWPASSWQVDRRFPEVAPISPHVRISRVISRETLLGDSIMTAIVLAPFGSAPWLFTDLGRLRLQECERVSALRMELTKCGGRVVEEGDTLKVFPSQIHGAEIETYDDHRMAMCFSILGLKIPGIKIKNPSCVKKTFPNFFQKLAATPPEGLGARILDAAGGRPLRGEELFAD